VRGTQEDLSKVGNEVKKLIKTVVDVGAKLETANNNLAMTNGVVQRLHGDHENTKQNLAGNTVDLQAASSRLQRLIEEHSKTARDVSAVRDELSKVGASHEHTREVMGKTVSSVKELQDGQGMLNTGMQGVNRSLERVHGLAAATQKDLKLTNAFVLPNLGGEPTPAGPPPATLTQTSLRSKSLITPRKQRQQNRDWA